MAAESTVTTPTVTPHPNPYGVLAWEHMARYLPDRFAQIPDPAAYFSDLGEQAAEEIETLTPSLAGTPPAEEDYLSKVGRMRMARLMAEEKVLAEMVYLTPTADPDDAPRDQTGAYLGHDPGMSPTWTPLWDGGNPHQQD